jgi:C-terminal processing protease CtpA/Prc
MRGDASDAVISAHRWLEPNGRLAERQPFDAIVVEFRTAANDAYAVVAVAPDSPGAVAGLQQGDLLLAMDGRDARGLTLGDIKTRLSRPGTTCLLRINQNGATRTVMLQLKERL